MHTTHDMGDISEYHFHGTVPLGMSLGSCKSVKGGPLRHSVICGGPSVEGGGEGGGEGRGGEGERGGGRKGGGIEGREGRKGREGRRGEGGRRGNHILYTSLAIRPWNLPNI